jgi:hypothetical protein
MKQILVPISKINEKTREVHGILANGIKDKDGEIMDYADSKPLFEKWSEGIKKASGGKSVGNLREMHQPIVAGKFTAITFNDADEQIEVITKVSNDSTWGKVNRGELTGFSIYGNAVYRKRDKVNKAIRYAVAPVEGSLVDNPCMYGADFTLIKENGEEIVAKFAGENKPYQFWHCLHDCDLLHKSEVEASNCNGIVAKSSILDDNDEDLEENDLVSKSMYDVSSLASNISSLKWITVDEDNKKKFGKAVAQLFSVLSGMVKVEAKNFEESLNALDNATTTMKTVGLNLIKEDKKMKLKVQKSASNKAINDEDDELFIDFDEEVLAAKIGKTVAKTAGILIKEVFADIKEDIEALSGAVQKISGLPKKSNVVVKSADRKKISDNDDVEKEPKKVEKISKTSDIEDSELMKVMKTALRNPTSMRQVDTDEEEESESESDEENEE